MLGKISALLSCPVCLLMLGKGFMILFQEEFSFATLLVSSAFISVGFLGTVVCVSMILEKQNGYDWYTHTGGPRSPSPEASKKKRIPSVHKPWTILPRDRKGRFMEQRDAPEDGDPNLWD